MSVDLLDGIMPTLASGTTESGGVWHNAGRTSADGHDDWLVWDLAGQSALATNQTYHVGLSTRGASANSASLHATIGYKDAAGNSNWVTSDPLPIGTSWGRAEATIVVPSGMTPFGFYVAAYGECPETWMMSTTLSYGAPVTLASGVHTPYATQDHVATEYSTKASQKILSDSITSEVKARAKTDGAVSDLSTRMEQTVNGINISLNKLTETDQQIHSWFDFGSDASGNPKLSMGSSSSPIVGEYSNTGTTYKDRSGATLLALDAANSTTGADHVVAKDISIGGWQWVPTNGGDNLTLVWKG